MPPEAKPQVDICNVSNVTKLGVKWQIRFTEITTRNRTFTAKTKRDVEARRQELLEQSLEATQPSTENMPLLDGSSRTWRELCQWYTRQVGNAYAEGNVARLHLAREACTAITALSAAYLPHSRIEELENELEALIEFVKTKQATAQKEGISLGAQYSESPTADHREQVFKRSEPSFTKSSDTV